jgi:hypothetical protein
MKEPTSRYVNIPKKPTQKMCDTVISPSGKTCGSVNEVRFGLALRLADRHGKALKSQFVGLHSSYEFRMRARSYEGITRMK